jgi:hypothetical protein
VYNALMSAMAAGISADELLAVAQEHGFTVSHVQRARWHRKGWLPVPDTQHLGKGHGTRSIYPEVARDQFLTICAVPERQRRSPLVEWCLWWRGYEMPMTTIRAFLGQAAAEWETAIRELRTPNGLSDTAVDAVERLQTQRLPRGHLRRARKRVGADRVPTYGYLVLLIAVGGFAGWRDPDDAEIVEKGLRFRQGRSRQADKWVPKDIAPDLVQLSQLLGNRPFTRVLGSVTDSDLTTARDELGRFVGRIGMLSREVARALGVDLLKDAIAEPSSTSEAMLLLFWMVLRTAGFPTANSTEAQTEHPRGENEAT